MSKQHIEKRLGFAAQGVKEVFVADRMTTAGALRRAMRAKGVISAGDLEWYGILASDPDSAPYLYKAGALERMEDDRHQPNIFFPAPKKKSSRPGVKIKFSAQFEVGRVYEHSFIGDYDAIVQWKVLSRTESTLTIKKVGEGNRNSATTPTRGEEKRVKINSDAQGEFVYPMGKFSMAPILRASKTTASRSGVKAKFADAALNQIRNNAAISDKILTLVSKGLSVPQAIDSVLGEGTYKRIGSEVYDELKKAKSSRPGVKAKMALTWRSGEFDPAKAFLRQVSGGFDMERLKDDLIGGKEIIRMFPKYKELGQKLVDGINMTITAIKQMKAESIKASRPGVKAKMAKRMVVDTITSGNQKHELGYESVMQPVAAGEPPHEWFRPIVRTTNLDTGKSSEKASQPHYTEKSARDWLKNYASSVKPSTDPLYAEYASNREKISKMMTRLAQARNNPELRQKLQVESDKLDARQREVAAQLQKRKSSRPGTKAKA